MITKEIKSLLDDLEDLAYSAQSAARKVEEYFDSCASESDENSVLLNVFKFLDEMAIRGPHGSVGQRAWDLKYEILNLISDRSVS